MNYTNPRLEAIIPDWPYGRDLRTTATFTIETHPKRGQRGVRTTIDPKTGRVSKPKTLTFARQVRIVDGDDGKTYLIELTMYGHISVMQSNMQFQHEAPIVPSDTRYAQLRAYFD